MRLTILNLLLVAVFSRLGVDVTDAFEPYGGMSSDQWKKQNLFISDIEISKEYNYPGGIYGGSNRQPNRESMFVPASFGLQDGDSSSGSHPQPADFISQNSQHISNNVVAHLAFVFELVPKMSDQLQNFKQTLPKILSSAHSNKHYDFGLYYWVPFNSSGVGKYMSSNDLQEFEREVNKTNIEDKVDSCHGVSLEALETAVNLVREGSVIYVFTHSYQEEANYYKRIAYTVLKKGIEVNFIQLKGCYTEYIQKQWEYDYLTALGSGQIYLEEPNIIPNVTQYITKELSELPVYFVTAYRQATKNQDEYKIAIDKSVSEMTISLAGSNVTLTIEDPKGKVYVLSPSETLLDGFYTKIYWIKSPEYGMWKVLIKSGASYNLRINGISDVRCIVQFYDENGIKQVHEPLYRYNRTIVVYTKSDVYLTQICGYNLKGEEIKCYPLKPCGEQKGCFLAPDVEIPQNPYYLEVKGHDESKVELQRLTSVAYSGMGGGQPSVTLQDKYHAITKEKVDMKCEILSPIPVKIKWYKNWYDTNITKECSASCESIYTIPSVEAHDYANYTCIAGNEFGYAQKTTQLLGLTDTPYEMYISSNKEDEQPFIEKFGDSKHVGNEPEKQSVTSFDFSGIPPPIDMILPFRSLSKKDGKM